MSAKIDSVLAEQQAVVMLLLNRCQATDQATPSTVESFLRVLFSHISVVEQVVLPAFRQSEQAAGVAEALRVVATYLAAAVAELRNSGTLALDSHLRDSIQLLFLAEVLLLRDAPLPERRALSSSLAEDAENRFLMLIGCDAPDETRAASLAWWS